MTQTMEMMISLVNDATVGVFGVLLSASFAGAARRHRNRVILMRCIIVMLFLHWLAYSQWSVEACSKMYPLIVHLPTVAVLWILTKKPLWSVISVLCAYLFCEIRRWFALLAAMLINGGDQAQKVAELAITTPLFLFLMFFASPAIRQIMYYPKKTQLQFGLIPAIYYAFDYITRRYTDLLAGGSPVVLEFMPFVCCVAYLMFLLYNFAEEHKREQLRQIQNNLDFQLSQAVREITRLRESQAESARYRHDLRHHLQYLSTCMENGQNERAQGYITDICEDIEAQKVIRYCENEAANLIISAFAGRAKKCGVDILVEGALPADVSVSDNDLCVLLSNSLENALNASLAAAKSIDRLVISLRFRLARNTGKLFMQITNPCTEKVKFENGVPLSSQPGHGIGVQSICAIVDRCGGCCTFLQEDNTFILRLSL